MPGHKLFPFLNINPSSFVDSKVLSMAETNRELRSQTDLLNEANDLAKSAAARADLAERDAAFARRMAILANIIAVIAMAIAVKDDVFKLISSW